MSIELRPTPHAYFIFICFFCPLVYLCGVLICFLLKHIFWAISWTLEESLAKLIGFRVDCVIEKETIECTKCAKRRENEHKIEKLKRRKRIQQSKESLPIVAAETAPVLKQAEDLVDGSSGFRSTPASSNVSAEQA